MKNQRISQDEGEISWTLNIFSDIQRVFHACLHLGQLFQ